MQSPHNDQLTHFALTAHQITQQLTLLDEGHLRNLFAIGARSFVPAVKDCLNF